MSYTVVIVKNDGSREVIGENGLFASARLMARNAILADKEIEHAELLNLNHMLCAYYERKDVEGIESY